MGGRVATRPLDISNYISTTSRRSTEEMPFSMTYGVEAIILLEIGFSTLRTSSFTSSNNDGL